MNRRSLIVKLFVPTWLVFFVIPTPVEAAFINGTFDLPGLPPGEPAQGISPLFMPSFITGWLAVPGFDGTNGIADYLHDGRSQDPGGYFVELGVMFTNIGLQQTFTSIPNQSYAVTFWLGTRIPFAPNDVRVSA